MILFRGNDEFRLRVRAFTLLELLVVISLIALLVVVVAPAFNTTKTADQITNAAQTITTMMEQARAVAIGKNTYSWLGFYEEDGGFSAALPTPTPSATPPYPGKGRLVMAIVYSNDGTEVIDPTASGPNPLPSTRVTQYGKLVKVENIHVTDIGSPTPVPNASPNSLEARSAEPYSSPSVASSSANRINSDSADATRFQFTAQGYPFWKTIRFSPRGEARNNTSYDYRRFAELGLMPTRGKAVDTASPNVVAIQWGAFGGHFIIYRR